jgi:FKBP-type peptidyl-prolyl cis-trans isomerase 2
MVTMLGTVTDDDDAVIVDDHHPLAGKSFVFSGERAASAEELLPRSEKINQPYHLAHVPDAHIVPCHQ